MQMLDECLTCIRFQKETTISNISTLVRLCELAAEKQESSQRQSKIDNFFSPIVTSNSSNANGLDKIRLTLSRLWTIILTFK